MLNEKTIRKMQKEWLENQIELVEGLARSEEWEEVIEQVHMKKELMSYAFKWLYPHIPEEYRRDFVIGCYEHNGDHIPSCRAAVRRLPKNGINELPFQYASQETITVYRAGEEPIKKAQYRISWTLDIEVAKRFYNKNRFATHLYRAVIRPRDVIAYNNNREEEEVMQYRSVSSIELLEQKNNNQITRDSKETE